MKRSLLILSLIMCISCSFLDEKLPTGVREVYDTEAALEANLRGVLVSLDNAASWTGEVHEKVVSGSGIVHWSMSQSTTRLNSTEWTDALKFTSSSSSSTASSFFSNNYYAVDKCNTLLEALPGSPVNEEYKKVIEGEAYFYRAFTYFNIVRFWGDAPLRTEAANISNTSSPRVKYDRIYVQVIRDFEKAYELMRTPQQVKEQVPGESRPHKYAAVAYLSSVYLTIGSLLNHHTDNFWDDTKPERQPDFSDLEIFEGLTFPLADDSQYQEAAVRAYQEALRYAEMLIPESDSHDPECPYRLCGKYTDLYSWNREFRDADGYDSWNLPERIFVYSITPQSSTAYLPKRTLPPNVEVTNNLLKTDGNAGRERPDRWFFQKWCETYPGNKGTGTLTKDVYMTSSDPRLDATMYHTSYYNLKDQVKRSIYPNYMSNPTHYYGMPYFKKYYSPEYDFNAGYADLYLMRLSQVYLNAAEAAAFLDDPTKAYRYMEVLHARARSTKSGATMPKWTSGQFADKDELMVAIFWERMFELCAEAGHEWFDTHRFGAAWLVENIAKPKNVFLQKKEQSGLEDGSYKYGTATTPASEKISYREFYYGKDFLYTEDPAQARKGLLLGFPSREEYYNNEIDKIGNDFGF